MRIGIDFDNTIVSFDPVFHRRALARKWIDASVEPVKKAVRDAIRTRFGDPTWTRLQAEVYSEGIQEAAFCAGFVGFLEWSRSSSIELFIISHKTQYAALPDRRIDLRRPAMDWLAAHGCGDFILGKTLFFEDTRAAKLKRITACGCTHFIDDLKEIFEEPDFPPEVCAIFYGKGVAPGRCKGFESWRQIRAFLGGEP